MEQLAGFTLTPGGGPTLCRSQRRLRGRVRPGVAGDVPAIVRDCQVRGWSIHPVSGGKNWGLGSFLPDVDDAVLLDLSGLKAIGPLDREAATVRIEAGVTQIELHDWLQREAPELAFNVTGAGRDTSIVGNAMERGLGYAGSRADELFGCEVVLADGSVHQPDPAWFSTTGSLPAGPRIDALWSQGNFGIVTAAWFRLRRRQEVEAAVVVSGGLEDVFETVRTAYRCGALVQPVHMAGNSRAGRLSAGLLQQLWGRPVEEEEARRIFPLVQGHTAICALHGTRRLVAAALAEIKARAPRGVRVRSVTEARLETALKWFRLLGMKDRETYFQVLKPLLALTWGEPGDGGLASLDLLPGSPDPDASPSGCIYFNAVSSTVRKVSLELEQIVKEGGLDYGMTRVFLSATLLVHVISVDFPASEAGPAQARVREIAVRLRDRGYPPYRLGQTTMEPVGGKLATRLKSHLDPHGVLSPGHYCA